MSIIKNLQIRHSIEQKGYVVLDIGTLIEFERVKEYIFKNFQVSESDFYYSLMAGSFEENRQLSSFLKQILGAVYEHFFVEYRTITESFLSKPANTSSELMLHQDWCYTDENKYSAYNIWIPLEDVTITNGAMCFIPGSHRWFNNLRSATYKTARVSMDEFAPGVLETIELRKGQAILFHPAVFHGSYPNHSDENRVVVTATILEENAPFLFFHMSTNSNEALVFQLDDEALLKDLRTLAIGDEPVTAKVSAFAYKHEVPTAEYLISKLKGN